MANNYCESSSFLDVPEGKLGLAREVIDRAIKEIEEADGDDDLGYCGCVVDIEGNGVWFRHDESINPDHVEKIARALVEELVLDGPFYCSWAYTCSKPRIDEFGGGAFVLARGVPTMWCDARSEVERQYVEYTESQKA